LKGTVLQQLGWSNQFINIAVVFGFFENLQVKRSKNKNKTDFSGLRQKMWLVHMDWALTANNL
jgi:hypothetical protein